MFRRQRSDRQGGKDGILLSLHPGQRSDRHPLLAKPHSICPRQVQTRAVYQPDSQGPTIKGWGGVERVTGDRQPQKKLESRMDNTQMK